MAFRRESATTGNHLDFAELNQRRWKAARAFDGLSRGRAPLTPRARAGSVFRRRAIPAERSRHESLVEATKLNLAELNPRQWGAVSGTSRGRAPLWTQGLGPVFERPALYETLGCSVCHYARHEKPRSSATRTAAAAFGRVQHLSQASDLRATGICIRFPPQEAAGAANGFPAKTLVSPRPCHPYATSF
jgi:hypothetical protein